ncbi:MAG: STT3 domain-containing protein [Nanoarchaeota archaeon]
MASKRNKKLKNKNTKKEISTKKETKDDNSKFKLPQFNNLKKYSKIIIPIFFLIICLSLSIYLRVQPADLPATEMWAEKSMIESIKQDIKNNVNAQFPNLPENEKNNIIDEQLNEALKKQKDEINSAIKQQSDFFKSHFINEEKNTTYLLAIDPWYFYGLTKNYIETGNEFGLTEEEAKDGYYHPLRAAGTPVEIKGKDSRNVRELHIYVNAFIYKINKLFNPDVSLMKVLFYVPVILGTLMIIPGFFLTRKIAGNFAALFAGIIIAIHPSLLTRTIGGFNDTDAYQILFPLFAIWFLFESFSSKNITKLSIWSILAGLSIGLFAFAWNGWSFIFLFLILTSIAILSYKILTKYNDLINFNFKTIFEKIKLNLYSFLIFILSSAIFITIFTSFTKFTNIINRIYSFLFDYKTVATTTIWPNVLTTVAELNPIGANKVLTQISLESNLLLFFGLIGIFLPMIYFKKNKTIKDWLFLVGTSIYYLIIITSLKSFANAYILLPILIGLPIASYILYNIYIKENIDIKFSTILLLYYGAVIFSGQNGVRFVLLLMPAFALSIGITIGFILKYLPEITKKYLELPKIVAIIIISLLFLILFINPIKSSFETSQQMAPSMNDGWYDVLKNIDDKASEDAIINSWWDFGHWFVAIAKRPTTFDGAMQNNPRAHWMGKALITPTENESVGILRYLSCGGNYGYDLIKEKTHNDSFTSVNILYDIIPKNKENALKILIENNISENDAKEILEYTHCDNLAENYLITSQDMVGKGAVWGHFGSWNFTKSLMYNQIRKMPENKAIEHLIENFNLSETKAKNYINEIKTTSAKDWISPWPGYLGSSNCNKINETTINCQDGIIFDLEKEEIMPLNLGDNIERYPKNILYFSEKENKTIYKEYNNKNIITLQNGRSVGVGIYKDGNQYKSILMDYELTNSMFTRLFFFENINNELEYFEMFDKTTTITGEKIIVWKINWDKYKEKINY